MSDKNVRNLTALGFSDLLVGLHWESMRYPHDPQIKKAGEIDNISKKFGLSHGIELAHNHLGTTSAVLGLCSEVPKNSVCAAAVICNSLAPENPNALVIQRLDQNAFWYLLIINKIPVLGPRQQNDCILPSLADVYEIFAEDFDDLGLTTTRLAFITNLEQDELKQFLRQPQSTDKPQQISRLSLGDFLEDKAVIKQSKISPISDGAFKQASTTIVSRRTALWLIAALVIGAAAREFMPSSKPNHTSAFGPGNNTSQSTESERVSREAAAEALRAFHVQEEADWLAAKLGVAGVNGAIRTLTNFIDNLPADLNGWQPRSIIYTLDMKTEKEVIPGAEFVRMSNIPDVMVAATLPATGVTFAPFQMPDVSRARLSFAKNVQTKWVRVDESGTTVNAFRNAIRQGTDVVYALSGNELVVHSIIPMEENADTMLPDAAIAYAKRTAAAAEHLNLISTLQHHQGEGNYGWVTQWTMSEIGIASRLMPASHPMFVGAPADAMIPLMEYALEITGGGPGEGYQAFKTLASDITNPRDVIITNAEIDLESEAFIIKGVFYEGAK